MPVSIGRMLAAHALVFHEGSLKPGRTQISVPQNHPHTLRPLSFSFL
nr:hypothetical protein [uncultured Kingella sp.]